MATARAAEGGIRFVEVRDNQHVVHSEEKLRSRLEIRVRGKLLRVFQLICELEDGFLYACLPVMGPRKRKAANRRSRK
jgi:hypothetical protein